jgi:hypothetical protein
VAFYFSDTQAGTEEKEIRQHLQDSRTIIGPTPRVQNKGLLQILPTMAQLLDKVLEVATAWNIEQCSCHRKNNNPEIIWLHHIKGSGL